MSVVDNITNTISVTLAGVPTVTGAKISNAFPLQGFGSHSYLLTFDVEKDANGNAIPGNFATPVTFSATTGDMTFSIASIAAPQTGGSEVVVTYNGNTIPSPYAISINNGYAAATLALTPSRYYIVVGTTSDVLVFSDAANNAFVGMFASVTDGNAVTIDGTGTTAYAANGAANKINALNLDSMTAGNTASFQNGTAGANGSIGFDRGSNVVYAITQSGANPGLYSFNPSLTTATPIFTAPSGPFFTSIAPVTAAGAGCLILAGTGNMIYAQKTGVPAGQNVGVPFVFASNPAGTAAYAFQTSGGNVITYTIPAACRLSVGTSTNVSSNGAGLAVSPNGQFVYAAENAASGGPTAVFTLTPPTTTSAPVALSASFAATAGAFSAGIDDAGDRLFVADASRIVRVFSVSGGSTPTALTTFSTAASSGTPTSLVVGP
jgi:hypothetical protein